MTNPGTPREARPFVGLGFLLIATAYAFLVGTVMAVELPAVVRDLGIAKETGTLSMTLLMATSAAVLVAVGRLADRFGRRRVCLAGVGLAVVSSLATACAWDAPTLLLARALQGVASAMILTSVALLKSMFPEGPDRSRAFAFFGASMGMGLTVAPLVGAVAMEIGSWRAAFWINVPILLVAYAGIGRYVPESRAEGSPVALDVGGTVLLGLSLLLALVGISEGARLGWWTPRAVGTFPTSGWPFAVSATPMLLAGAVVAFGSFLALERNRITRGLDALIEPDLLGVRTFRLGCGVSFLFVLGGYSLQFVVPLCGVSILEIDPGQTGLLTALIGVGIVSGGLAAAPLGTRFGSRGIVVSGLALMMVGILALREALAPSGALPAFSSALFVIGTGYGLTYARITEVTLVDVPADRVGLASGMLVATRTCAMALGAAGLTSVILTDLLHGGGQSGEVLLDVRFALALCVGALLAALLCATRLAERDSDHILPSAPRSRGSIA